VDEIQFRSEFKKRLAPQLTAWIDGKNIAERRELPVADLSAVASAKADH
jgi:hypothetical protein